MQILPGRLHYGRNGLCFRDAVLGARCVPARLRACAADCSGYVCGGLFVQHSMSAARLRTGSSTCAEPHRMRGLQQRLRWAAAAVHQLQCQL